MALAWLHNTLATDATGPPFGDKLMVGRCVIALGCSGFSNDGDDVVQRNVVRRGWQ